MPPSTSPDRDLLKGLLETPIDLAIPADHLAKALSDPPFISVPGSLNMRDLGAITSGYMATGRVFRSGMLDFIPQDHRPLLRTQLGVQKVYDLRRNDELRGGVASSDIDGFEVVSCPYKDGMHMPKPIILADFAPQSDGTIGTGYQKMYEDILDGYTTGFTKVFEGLRDTKDGDAVLFHCTGMFVTVNRPVGHPTA